MSSSWLSTWGKRQGSTPWCCQARICLLAPKVQLGRGSHSPRVHCSACGQGCQQAGLLRGKLHQARPHGCELGWDGGHRLSHGAGKGLTSLGTGWRGCWVWLEPGEPVYQRGSTECEIIIDQIFPSPSKHPLCRVSEA